LVLGYPWAKNRKDSLIFLCEDARELPGVGNGSVSLIVTSPPYFQAGQEYEEWSSSLDEYLSFLKDCYARWVEVLRPGGRICLNIAGVHRHPYIPIQSHVHLFLLGFYPLLQCVGEHIWFKGHALGVSTAWGSWRKPSAPCIRDNHEYILVYQKRSKRITKNGSYTLDREGDCDGILPDGEEFVIGTRSVWEFSPRSSKEHPAVFPFELARRCILLYSWPGDIVLDPFCGIGTTCIVAEELGRRWIGSDIEEEYIAKAQNAMKQDD